MQEDSSEIHSLEPKYFFGLTTGLSNNCLFLNDEKLVYHASGVIVIHDYSNNSQKFVYLNEPQKVITTMDINNNKYIITHKLYNIYVLRSYLLLHVMKYGGPLYTPAHERTLSFHSSETTDARRYFLHYVQRYCER